MHGRTLISEVRRCARLQDLRAGDAGARGRNAPSSAQETGTPTPSTIAEQMAAWAKKLHQEAILSGRRSGQQRLGPSQSHAFRLKAAAHWTYGGGRQRRSAGSPTGRGIEPEQIRRSSRLPGTGLRPHGDREGGARSRAASSRRRARARYATGEPSRTRRPRLGMDGLERRSTSDEYHTRSSNAIAFFDGDGEAAAR